MSWSLKAAARSSSVRQRQLDLCSKFKVKPAPLNAEARIAIAKGFRSGIWPMNGLRHPVHGNMCGWYLWAGEEFSTEADWFDVTCYRHLEDENHPTVPYLFLPAGYRFLFAPGQEEVWPDTTLLSI